MLSGGLLKGRCTGRGGSSVFFCGAYDDSIASDLKEISGQLSSQFDLLAIRAAKHHPAPALFPGLSRRGVVRRPDHLDAVFLQIRHGLVKIFRLQAEVKAGHRAVGSVRQLQDRIRQFEVSDLLPRASGRRVLEIFFEAEMPLVKIDGALEIADMKRDMVDSPEHGYPL